MPARNTALFLSEETALALEGTEGTRALESGPAVPSPGWRTIDFGALPRLGFVLPDGARAVFAPVEVVAGDVGLMTVGLARPASAGDKLRVLIRFRPVAEVDAAEIEVIESPVVARDQRVPWVEFQFGLDRLLGRTGAFVVECRSGTPVDELVLYEFIVSDAATLDLNRARAFKALRIRNEQANFDAYYQLAMFQDQPARPEAVPGVPTTAAPAPTIPSPAVSIPAESASIRRLLKRTWRALAHPGVPESGIRPAEPASILPNAFVYSHAQLHKKLALTPPPFGWRLQSRANALAPGAPMLRILSLCSGAARIEADLVRGLPPGRVSMTLVDFNPSLLATAAARLSPWCSVQTRVGNVNELDLQGEAFDVILCVSGLHHVVELEHLIGAAAAGLVDGGEFWSIGETLGRNGGRMWPQAYEEANPFFMRLDERYRHNRMTGSVDVELPDLDYSIGCFEGIRCESIEPVLLRFLVPVDVCKYNCIIWRLFGPAYMENYDMSRADDRALVDEAVDLDVGLHRRGGWGIELHGIYRKPAS